MTLKSSAGSPNSPIEASKPAELPATAANGAISELARKRLEKFAALMPRVIVSDDVETIHDVRVWSRRLQQMLNMLAPQSVKKNEPRKLARRLRRIRRILGRPRNFDVLSQLVEEKIGAARNPVARDAWDQFGAYLADRRARAVERSREKLRNFDLVDFAARARALIDAAREALEHNLAKSVSDALAEWRAAIDTAKAQSGTEQVHALRIAGKRLRYRVELLAELCHGPAKARVKSLRKLQDQLGAWHDRQVLVQTCAKFLSRKDFLAGHPGLARALLVEMERERRRASATVDGLVKHAEKTSRAFGEIEFATPHSEIAAPVAGEALARIIHASRKMHDTL